jgi:hypothetical protein
MATPSISAAGLARMPSVPRARPWRSLTAGLRQRSVPRGRQTARACFGTLPAKEQMVVKGLSASLPCLPAMGDKRR